MYQIRIRLISVLFFVAVLLTGCSRNTVRTADELLTVPASTGFIRKTAVFVGNISSGQSDSPVWQTNGVIETVYVGLGDEVREGQILATLENDFLSAAVLNAEIPLISALEELEEVLSSETPKAQAYMDLKNAEAALISAEAYRESLKYPHAVSSDIAYWSGQVDIYRETYEAELEKLNGMIAWRRSPVETERDQYEAQRKTMLSALGKYAEVYNNFLYYSGTPTENDIAQAAANIGTAQAAYEKALKYFRTFSQYPREKDLAAAQLKVENARNTWNHRNIIAAINGVVTEVNAREGDYVTKQTAAFRLDNITHLYIPLDISEIDILEFQEGMKALIVLDSNPAITYNGMIARVSASGETSDSRVTFEVLVEILDPDENVRLGMTAEVSLILSEVNDALLVPANAVFRENGTAYVTVSNGTSVYDVPVVTGISTDTVTQISGGYLREGDLVCVPSIDSTVLQDMGLSGTSQRFPG